ncbi:hypothetical protein BASA60_005040 [Batrachochytrium salamandrivorans]|nr:hypothetical protein BASA60_005040 [Batrachochytrium salamandrivorans]
MSVPSHSVGTSNATLATTSSLATGPIPTTNTGTSTTASSRFLELPLLSLSPLEIPSAHPTAPLLYTAYIDPTASSIDPSTSQQSLSDGSPISTNIAVPPNLDSTTQSLFPLGHNGPTGSLASSSSTITTGTTTNATTTNTTTTATANGSTSTIALASSVKPILSLASLSLLHSELARLASLAALRVASLRANQTSLVDWLNRVDPHRTLRRDIEKDKGEKRSRSIKLKMTSSAVASTTATPASLLSTSNHSSTSTALSAALSKDRPSSPMASASPSIGSTEWASKYVSPALGGTAANTTSTVNNFVNSASTDRPVKLEDSVATPSSSKKRSYDSEKPIAKTGGENGTIKLAIMQNGIIKITPPTHILGQGSCDQSATSGSPAPQTPQPSNPPYRSDRDRKMSKSHGSQKDRYRRRGGSSTVAANENASASRATPEPEVRLNLDGDFSHAKAPSTQVPIAQFWSFFEQYYRNMTEDDLRGLLYKGDDITPFLIPPLGRHFTEQWHSEDQRLFAMFEEGATNPSLMANRDERIMCALVQEGVVPDIKFTDDDDDMSGGQAGKNTPVSYNGGVKAFGLSTSGMPGITGASAGSAASKPRTRMDMAVFEDRLRLELCHLGLVDVADDDNASRIQDDEIFMELRSKQDELREHILLNSRRKRRIHEIAEKWMGWQEYNGLLDEINKNLEQGFAKRLKSGKSRKGRKPVKEHRPVSESLIAAMESRKRLIRDVGDVFFPVERFAVPSESVFQNLPPPEALYDTALVGFASVAHGSTPVISPEGSTQISEPLIADTKPSIL